MNFKEAYQKMLEGKKVRRKDWGSGQYYSLLKDKIFFIDRVIVLNITVEDSLADDWEVVEEKRQYWKPKKDEKYYFITAYEYDVCVMDDMNDEVIVDDNRINMGNCFKTEEEAEHMVEKLKVIHELQKFAYENNEGEIDWKNFNQCKYYLVYDTKDEDLYVDYSIQCESEPFNIYFTSSKIAKRAIEAVGEDRIKKYYFNVED